MATTEKPASGDALATAELKSTAKWLVGASASIATAIVAGLQLTSLDKLGEAELWVGLLALGAASLSLLAVFRVLDQAAAVLSVTRAPIDTLDRKDRDDHGNYPKGARIERPDTPLIKELVVQRRTELLGVTRDAIGSLTDDYSSVGKSLAATTAVNIVGRNYDPTVPADLVALQGLAAELELRIQYVSDAAERFETAEKYQKLKSCLIAHGIAFLIGIFAFAWLTILYPHRLTETVKVSTALQVEITVPSENAAKKAGMAKDCAGQVLSGAAVGGTLDKPVVVTRAKGRCIAYRLTDTKDLIVVPLAAK